MPSLSLADLTKEMGMNISVMCRNYIDLLDAF